MRPESNILKSDDDAEFTASKFTVAELAPSPQFISRAYCDEVPKVICPVAANVAFGAMPFESVIMTDEPPAPGVSVTSPKFNPLMLLIYRTAGIFTIGNAPLLIPAENISVPLFETCNVSEPRLSEPATVLLGRLPLMVN